MTLRWLFAFAWIGMCTSVLQAQSDPPQVLELSTAREPASQTSNPAIQRPLWGPQTILQVTYEQPVKDDQDWNQPFAKTNSLNNPFGEIPATQNRYGNDPNQPNPFNVSRQPGSFAPLKPGSPGANSLDLIEQIRNLDSRHSAPSSATSNVLDTNRPVQMQSLQRGGTRVPVRQVSSPRRIHPSNLDPFAGAAFKEPKVDGVSPPILRRSPGNPAGSRLFRQDPPLEGPTSSDLNKSTPIADSLQDHGKQDPFADPPTQTPTQQEQAKPDTAPQQQKKDPFADPPLDPTQPTTPPAADNQLPDPPSESAPERQVQQPPAQTQVQPQPNRPRIAPPIVRRQPASRQPTQPKTQPPLSNNLPRQPQPQPQQRSYFDEVPADRGRANGIEMPSAVYSTDIIQGYDDTLRRDTEACGLCSDVPQASYCAPSYYVSLFAGGSSAGDVNTIDNSGASLEYEFDTGYGLGIAVGQSQGFNLRTELEFAFRNYGFESIAVGSTPLVPTNNQLFNLDGNLNTYSGMTNVYWEFMCFPTPCIKPYVGGGVGFVMFDPKFKNLTPSQADSDFAASSFAYQFIAGLNFKRDVCTDFFVEYRYFAADNVRIESNVTSLRGLGTGAGDFDLSFNDLFFGIRVKF